MSTDSFLQLYLQLERLNKTLHDISIILACIAWFILLAMSDQTRWLQLLDVPWHYIFWSMLILSFWRYLSVFECQVAWHHHTSRYFSPIPNWGPFSLPVCSSAFALLWFGKSATECWGLGPQRRSWGRGPTYYRLKTSKGIKRQHDRSTKLVDSSRACVSEAEILDCRYNVCREF